MRAGPLRPRPGQAPEPRRGRLSLLMTRCGSRPPAKGVVARAGRWCLAGFPAFRPAVTQDDCPKPVRPAPASPQQHRVAPLPRGSQRAPGGGRGLGQPRLGICTGVAQPPGAPFCRDQGAATQWRPAVCRPGGMGRPGSILRLLISCRVSVRVPGSIVSSPLSRFHSLFVTCAEPGALPTSTWGFCREAARVHAGCVRRLTCLGITGDPLLAGFFLCLQLCHINLTYAFAAAARFRLLFHDAEQRYAADRAIRHASAGAIATAVRQQFGGQPSWTAQEKLSALSALPAVLPLSCQGCLAASGGCAEGVPQATPLSSPCF